MEGKLAEGLVSHEIVESFVSYENDFGLYLRPMESH